MYISLTALKPKGIIGYIRFWIHAIPSFNQAKQAKGVLSADVKKIDVYHCTLSSWNSREEMLVYLRAGAHLTAMKAFHKIATGRSYGYEAETLPTWEEAFKLVMEKGKIH